MSSAGKRTGGMRCRHASPLSGRGLAACRSFARSSGRAEGRQDSRMVSFEKQSDWGGLWNYTWRTGLDEYGEPVHGSMYRYLWSNGPKECLEFADYTFDGHFGSRSPRSRRARCSYDYITGRAKKSGVRKQGPLLHAGALRRISADDGQIPRHRRGPEDRSTRSEEFDYVIVSTGHFSVPNVPHFEGVEKFPGRVMHGHDFRDAQEFSGKSLLVVGASYSAEDIALQCHKYGAKSVTMCWRTKPMGFHWPEGMDERPLLTQARGQDGAFQGRLEPDVDAIILCTGYQHHFPFLEEKLG